VAGLTSLPVATTAKVRADVTNVAA
jgi:hypothetical protein